MINKNKKKIFSFFLALFIGGGVFFLAPGAHATIGDWAGEILGGLIGWIISALGLILVLVMKALVLVAQYSDFIHSPAVSHGWTVVRDVCNMFFVLVLLIIAFATILKIENYNYKKWLPKLILMAILINFSKTICGLLIDFAQVVMLTFVNAFKDIAAGNLITNLGITDILTLSQSSDKIGFWAIIGSYVLGLIYVLIALVVITTMLAMLVMRIVMIWIYVVLSPLAYLMSAFPGGQKYSSQWWSEFTKNLIVGPVLAFFIWLSFTALQAQTTTEFNESFKIDSSATTESVAAEAGITGGTDTTGTNASTPGVFIKFVIAIGMLIGGLKISQEIGGAAGGIAGKGMAAIQKGQAFVGKKSKDAVKDVTKNFAKSVGRGSLGAASFVDKKIGEGLAMTRFGQNKVGKKISETMVGTGKIGLAWRSDLLKTRQKEKQDKREKFMKNIGMKDKSMDKVSEFLKTDTGKEFAAASTLATSLAPVTGVAGLTGGFALGGAISWGAKKINRGLDKKAKKELAKADTLQEEADSARSAGLTEEADKKAKQAEKIREKASWWEAKREALKKPLEAIQSFASANIQKAAANGSKKISDARERVGVLAKDPNALAGPMGFAPSTFYSKSGQSDAQKENFNQLVAKDNPDSLMAINNLESWVNNGEQKSEKEIERMEALIQGIAAYKKGGGDVSRLSGLIAALDSHGQNEIGAVDSQTDKVIANRKTGMVGEFGSGAFAVNTFANNSANEDGKNIIGVDFNKMAGAGLDVKAEASFASGKDVAPIVSALKDQISTERNSLNSQHDSGNINDEEFASRLSDLDKAEARLNDPNQMKNIQLVNTGSANYGRQERMTSIYHEEIHNGGVKDEDLTERMAKSLMENKLYGRNAATKGRHATEVAKMAKDMKDQGMNNDDIMKAVDSEIKSRVASEAKNRAERVLKLEKGEKETESESIREKPATKLDTLNTEEFQNSLDSLAKKIEESFSNIKTPSVESNSAKLDITKLLFPLKQLNANVKKNSLYARQLNVLIGKNVPSSPMEASAVNQEMSKSE